MLIRKSRQNFFKQFEKAFIRCITNSVDPRANHRSWDDRDKLACKRVDGRPSEDCVSIGLRYEQDVINIDEEFLLVNEMEQLRSAFGFIAGESQSVQSERFESRVQALRVTGRPEASTQVVAPWGYADNFQRDNLTMNLRLFIENLEKSNKFCIKPECLRDVTINFRSQSMFMLDPHIDPPLDGGNVFILGLKSDVVITFTPDLAKLSDGPSRIRIRTDPSAIALRSWTDEDVDVLLKQRSLLHFCEDARFKWKHAIRVGLDVGEPYNAICDWWGDLNHLVKRNNERISIILAYA